MITFTLRNLLLPALIVSLLSNAPLAAISVMPKLTEYAQLSSKEAQFIWHWTIKKIHKHPTTAQDDVRARQTLTKAGIVTASTIAATTAIALWAKSVNARKKQELAARQAQQLEEEFQALVNPAFDELFEDTITGYLNDEDYTLIKKIIKHDPAILKRAKDPHILINLLTRSSSKKHEDAILEILTLAQQNGTDFKSLIKLDNSRETTYLHEALTRNNYKIARFLIPYSQLDLQDRWGKTALSEIMEAVLSREDRADHENSLFDLFQTAIKSNADLKKPFGNEGEKTTYLHLAIRHNFYKLAKLLVPYSDTAAHDSRSGSTALQQAIDKWYDDKDHDIFEQNLVELFKSAIASGADLKKPITRGDNSSSYLHKALNEKFYNLAKLLIPHSDLSICDDYSKQPALLRELHNKPYKEDHAQYEQRLLELFRIAHQSGAPFKGIVGKEHGRTTYLVSAIECKFYQVAKFIVSHTDFTTPDSNLDLAYALSIDSYSQKVEHENLLLELLQTGAQRGATLRSLMDIGDKKSTLLHIAVQCERYKLAKFLVPYSDLTAKDYENLTAKERATDLAKHNNSNELKELLQQMP